MSLNSFGVGMSPSAYVSNATARLKQMDHRPLNAFQLQAVLMTAGTVILDGLDNQMLGLAAPSLIAEWAIDRSALGWVFALGFIGMAFGTIVSGWIGDKFGRRSALILGVVIFGVATFLTGFSTNLEQVALLRTIAGIGLGGVPGTAAAMISEYTPIKWRTVAVTFGVVCVSIGGILGGVMAALILPSMGWRWLFYIGGVLPLVFAATLYFILPESPRFLLSRPNRFEELERILVKMKLLKSDVSSEEVAAAKDIEAKTEQSVATFIIEEGDTDNETSGGIVSSKLLLKGRLLRDTLALCVAMFSGMFMIYLMFNWAPTLLDSQGFDLAVASFGLTVFNIGGTIGALIASIAMIRFGSRPILIMMAIIGSIVCGALAFIEISGGQNKFFLLLGLTLLGLSASAAQSAMFAVGTNVFPTALRARGMGVMGASGRIGAIISAFAGSLLIGWNNFGFFGVLAILMLVNCAGFALIKAHVPKAANG
tara:strand:+ start:774 stop:2219 length:1446 start_codon:yes stop_codon:yes gene_type:complete